MTEDRRMPGWIFVVFAACVLGLVAWVLTEVATGEPAGRTATEQR